MTVRVLELLDSTTCSVFGGDGSCDGGVVIVEVDTRVYSSVGVRSGADRDSRVNTGSEKSRTEFLVLIAVEQNLFFLSRK